MTDTAPAAPRATTTRVLSVSVPVADQDAALRFYTEVLGFALSYDTHVDGTRMIELVPPGSDVALVLLPPDADIPVAVRLGTTDAAAAHDAVRAAGVRLDNDEVLRWEGVPPMFAFADPDGNRLVFLEDRSSGESDVLGPSAASRGVRRQDRASPGRRGRATGLTST